MTTIAARHGPRTCRCRIDGSRHLLSGFSSVGCTLPGNTAHATVDSRNDNCTQHGQHERSTACDKWYACAHERRREGEERNVIFRTIT